MIHDGEGYSTEEEIFQPTKPKTAMAAHVKTVIDSAKKSDLPQIGNEGDVGLVRAQIRASIGFELLPGPQFGKFSPNQ